MASHVTCTVEDGIAQVRLDRPDKLNALTLEILDDLVTTAHDLRRDRTLRAVVLAGEGDAFCAGLDFGVGAQGPSRIARASCLGPGAGPTRSRRPAGPGAGSRCR